MAFPGIDIILLEVWNIFLAPFQQPAIFWEIGPFILLWIAMELYFGTHKKEKLGWNTALGNGLSLFWVIISGMKQIFLNGMENFTLGRFIILLAITLYALFIIFTSFKHSFSNKFQFLIASPGPMYYFSLIALLFAHNLLQLEWLTIIAVFVLFIMIQLLTLFFRLFLPELSEDTEDSMDDDFKDNSFKDTSFKDDTSSFGGNDSSTDFSEDSLTNEDSFSKDSLDETYSGDSIDSLASDKPYEKDDFKF